MKREKEKEKKKENLVKRKEEDEKDRFLQLSDREKVGLIFKCLSIIYVCF